METLTSGRLTEHMTDNQPDGARILVLGGTGKTGRRVAQQLARRGMATRMGSRSAQPAFDWDQPATWPAALGGIDSVYLSFFPDLAVPGAPETVASFAKLAVHNGVNRLVLLSGRGEEGARLSEQAVRESGAEWTILRSSWFSQNFSEGYLLHPVVAGDIALPVGDVGEPFVDVEDLVAVAVAALTEDRHTSQLYELTGPRLLSFDDAINEIGQAVNRDIRFTSITIEQYSRALVEQDVPAEVVSLLLYLFTEVLDGRNAHLNDGVQRALGRPPRDFTTFARDAAHTGVWNKEIHHDRGTQSV